VESCELTSPEFTGIRRNSIVPVNSEEFRGLSSPGFPCISQMPGRLKLFRAIHHLEVTSISAAAKKHLALVNSMLAKIAATQ
jgi:hypothetical protein